MKGFVLFVQQTEQTMRVRVCLHKSTKNTPATTGISQHHADRSFRWWM